jgi:hypothetical protein
VAYVAVQRCTRHLPPPAWRGAACRRRTRRTWRRKPGVVPHPCVGTSQVSYPLGVEAESVVVSPCPYNPDLVRRIFPRLDWNVLLRVFHQLGRLLSSLCLRTSLSVAAHVPLCGCARPSLWLRTSLSVAAHVPHEFAQKQFTIRGRGIGRVTVARVWSGGACAAHGPVGVS